MKMKLLGVGLAVSLALLGVGIALLLKQGDPLDFLALQPLQ